MENSNIDKYRRIGRLCGMVMVVAGIVITIISALETGGEISWWRLASGIIFILTGFLYIFLNYRLKK